MRRRDIARKILQENPTFHSFLKKNKLTQKYIINYSRCGKKILKADENIIDRSLVWNKTHEGFMFWMELNSKYIKSYRNINHEY